MAIASRRQIDHKEAGGGYVENWTSAEFASSLSANDPSGLIAICRDHGGPWQQPLQWSADPVVELENALASFRSDIDAGFNLLHIDTSKASSGSVDIESALDRLTLLYRGAWEHARLKGRDISFEIGFEVQGEEMNDPRQFQVELNRALDGLSAAELPMPVFVVAQTGTKVVEDKNTGALVRGDRNRVLDGISVLSALCHDASVQLKAHNVDYLDPAEVTQLMTAGVDAINVAPEFGVIETRVLLQAMRDLDARDLREAFVSAAVESGRWKSWIVAGKTYDPETLAILSGHYIFSSETGKRIRNEVDRRRAEMGQPSVDIEILDALRSSIEGYQSATQKTTNKTEAHVNG
ncbi:hypothetical protein AB4Y87_15340 [Paenarthrobacter sp. RAF54_2]|uniref:hypothetical protein n=1 Tax=unclassified Paenarthrobacter TaxID=2634190 RepID=UPI003F982C35